MTANTTGSDNTAIGRNALQSITSGSQNTAIGLGAGSANSQGTGNVFVGYMAGSQETGSNKLYIDNSATTTPLIHGDFDTDTVTLNGDVKITGNLSADKVISTSGKSVMHFEEATGAVHIGQNSMVFYDSAGAIGNGQDIMASSVGRIQIGRQSTDVTNFIGEVNASLDPQPCELDLLVDLEIDGDGVLNQNDIVIDGDGVSDTLYSDIPGWDLDTSIVLDTDITRKPEPLNVNEKSRSIYAISLDASKKIYAERNMSVSVYAQFAALIGKTSDPVSGRDTTLGTGLIPFGLSTKFGPARLKFEYRIMPQGRFEFGYWDRSYEIERATFSSTNVDILSGGSFGEIITKDSRLGKFGKQKGYFSTLSLDLGAMIGASMSYQNLFGEQWSGSTNSFIEDRNQSFIASVGLKKPISRITNARWYYQQRNVPNPFEFEFTESTITGYRVGIKLGNGMILNYIFRRSFRDIDGDGKVNGPDETINMTSIEPSFSF